MVKNVPRMRSCTCMVNIICGILVVVVEILLKWTNIGLISLLTNRLIRGTIVLRAGIIVCGHKQLHVYLASSVVFRPLSSQIEYSKFVVCGGITFFCLFFTNL